MANRSKTMGSIRQILRLQAAGKSIKFTAKTLGISKNTVRKYRRLAESFQIELPVLLTKSDEELSVLFDPPNEANAKSRYDHFLGQVNYFEKELNKTGVSRWLLWGEYKAKYPPGYNYSQFCYHLQQWRQSQDVRMHFEHKAGEKLFVDYTGKKLCIVDQQSGEVTQTEVFVAILGASQLTYVEATFSQNKADFYGALARSLHYIGGVVQVIIPDNLKTAVSKPSNYEALLNPTAEDFANYYQTSFMPARVRKPRDKSLVENAVGIIYRRIFAKLRNEVFHDLRALNQAIWDLLRQHNETPFQQRDYSRRDRFEQIEKHTLQALPPHLYELKEFATAKVGPNYHVQISKKDGHYYSVPHNYKGKRVKLAYTSSQVEIFHQHQRIAYHIRSFQEHRYTTVGDHMPSTHRFVSEWCPEKFIKWGGDVGPPTQQYIKRVLDAKPYPEQAYKSCIGILNLAKKVGNKRLNQACERAMTYNSFGYMVIKNILEKRLDEVPVEKPQTVQLSLPFHENIRGQDYYQ